MKHSIYNFMEDYYKKNNYSFHMPAHKNNPMFLPTNLLQMDATEIEGTDNLHNPSSIILQTQQNLANLVGADESFLLINGSTSGLIGAMLAVSSDGSYVLVARNAHKSVFSGMVLSGAKPQYIWPETMENGLMGGIDPAKVSQMFLQNPAIKAVFITSPTYEGVVSNIAAIAEIVHKHNAILVVDEAHGAHFSFLNNFPPSAVELGADIVVQSLHKSLPVMGQVSVLHLCGNRVNKNRLKQTLAMVQTSSPSYMLMSQADYALTLMNKKKIELFEGYVVLLERTRKQLMQCQNITLLGNEMVGKHHVFAMDLAKLVFMIHDYNTSGSKMEVFLRECFRVQLEMGSLFHAIGITSCADNPVAHSALVEGVLAFDKTITPSETKIPLPFSKICYAEMSPRQAMQSETKLVPLDVCQGCVCGTFVTPYPPGVPLIVPGEIITKALIEAILHYQKEGIEVLGVQNNQLLILR